jgi:hypothetical protein
LIWLSEGKLVSVSGAVLRELITKHIVTVRLTNRDGNWVREFSPLVPPQRSPEIFARRKS